MKRSLTFVMALVASTAAFGLLGALRASAPLVPSNTWAATGDMAQVRAGASAALFQGGRVLITGGVDEHGRVLATAERYSPTSGGFMATPPMQTPRANHTSALLPDGRVLIAGGVGSDSLAVASTEIYDPATNSWAPGAPMHVARRGHTATVLANGLIVIAGGDDGATAIDSLEVYDPAVDVFTYGNGHLSVARTRHAAALVGADKVLIAGGSDGATPLASTDIYDASTGSIAAGPSLSTERAGLSATSLLDGKVLLSGGANASGALASAEIFDPATNALAPAGSPLGAARQNHVALLLPHNNQVLIVGGNAGGHAVATAELYTPWQGAGGTFCATAVCASGFAGPAAPAVARTWAAGSSLSFPAGKTNRSGPADGLLLLAGGSGVQSAELFGFATIKTDKEDYAPGTTVTITGSGWQPGEWVTLLLQESPNLDEHPLVDVQADDNGNIVSTEFVPDQHDVGIRFYLTAFGTASQAQTMFWDDKVLTVTFAGTGHGIVLFRDTTAPALNLNCTATCSPTVGDNDIGTLTASASLGSVFAGWSAQTAGITGCAGAACNFSMGNNAQSVTATFTLLTTQLVFTTSPQTLTAGVTSGVITVERRNAANVPQTVGTYIVGLSTTSAGGVFRNPTDTSMIGTITIPDGESSADFKYKDTTAGTPTIAASFTGLTSATQVEAVNAAAASKLTFSQQPTTTVAGQSIAPAVKVQIQDQFGNLTGSTATVAVAIGANPGSGTLGGTTSTAAVAGVTTLSNLSINKTGTGYTLTAASPGLTGATSSTFNITSGPATTLVVAGYPSPTLAAASHAFTVTAKDALANTATGYAGTVHFTSSDGAATLPVNYTFVAGDNGTHAFNATFNTGGTQWLTATDAVTASITSTQSGIVVNKAPAITSANSATFLAGSVGSFTITTTGFPSPTLVETGALPSGVMFTDNGDGTGTLGGSTTATGTFNIVFTANNGIGTAATQNFTLTVNQAPAITSANSTSFVVTSAGTFNVTATGFPTPTISRTGALPSGVTFADNGNGTATLAGAPALGSVGSYPLTIAASNGVGTAASQSFTLIVGKTGVSFASLTASQSIAYGASTISVSGRLSGPPMLTGTVTVTVAGASSAALSLSGNLNNFGGTIPTAAIPPSATSYTITYTYSGDSNTNGATDMTTTVTVTPKTLTASIANNPTKPYDGNSGATLTASNFLLAGLVGTDEITVTKTTGTYDNANVAAASMVATSLAAGDFAPVGSTLLSNYTLPTTASGTGHITAQTLTASIVGDPTKPYDGNTNATLTAGHFSLSGLVGSDTITVTQNSGTYNSASVAAADTVTASLASTDFAAGGTTQLTNYTLAASASGPGHITTATLIVHVTAAGATYTALAYAGATTCTADGVNSEHPTATLTFVGAGGTTYASSSTPPTNAGSYNAVCSAGGAATDYAAATGAAAFTIAKADQAALVLTAPATATYGQTGLSASATGGTGTGIVHYSVNPGSTACAVDGTTGALTITSGTGACQVAARKAGDDNDNPVMSNVVTIVINKASQTITFVQPLTPRTYGEMFAVAAATDSRLTVAIGASGGCAIDGSNTVTMTSGTTACALTASQPGNDNYSAATDVVRTVNAQKKAQIITVTTHAPATAIFGTVFTVAATGGASGSPVTLSSGSAVCTNAGGFFTMASGTGICNVQYDQAGNANYGAAIQVVEPTAAQKAPQTITFGALGTHTFGDPPFIVSATGGGSGNPVTFFSTTPGVCTTTGANGSTVTLVAASTCTVTASQAGNGNYNPAGDVVQSLTMSYNICALYDQTKSVQKNATVPVKLYLCTAAGGDMSSSSITVKATGLVRVSTGAAATLEDSGNANPENTFRFDPTLGPSGGYIFNLSTKPLGAGTGIYALQLTAGSDPATHTVLFGVK